MSDARAVLDGATTERELQDQVLELLRLYGWVCYHTWRSDHSEAGFPDIIATNGKVILAIECKREHGKVTVAQQRWLDLLHSAGAYALTLRPSDMDAFIEWVKKRQGPKHGQ